MYTVNKQGLLWGVSQTRKEQPLLFYSWIIYNDVKGMAQIAFTGQQYYYYHFVFTHDCRESSWKIFLKIMSG